MVFFCFSFRKVSPMPVTLKAGNAVRKPIISKLSVIILLYYHTINLRLVLTPFILI